ncbi:MAG: FtsW/RodA/SpoVE family cell cycle protein [Lachnospiraceae bacterium]|nr:FtsW/RodA/SpoVE family cell cycle protein [Lachnospiraceae bacterium]
MFDLVIYISRYLFIFYIGLFIFESAIFIVKRKSDESSLKVAMSVQRLVIVFMHLTAFLILSYVPGEFKFDIYTLIMAAASLIFLLIANHFALKIYAGSRVLLWNSVFFLLDVGIITLYRLTPKLAIKQLLWMIVGFIIMILIPYVLRFIKKIYNYEYFFIAFALILICLTLYKGEASGGSLNWLSIAGVISFQPSEIVKFLFIFYLASAFKDKVSAKNVIVSGVFSAAIVLLLVVQRDLGGALIFFTTYMLMLYMATSNSILFFGGMGAACIASVFAYTVFSHVRVRVSAWINPWADIESGGYQIVQSLFAITTWGFLGSGLTKGMPEKIPVVARDFIFSAICEEFGAFFGICLIFIYLVVFYCGVKIALSSSKKYYSMISAGIITMFSFQTFLILGGNTKFIPLTGVTLPFVSYGGSSILVSFVMIGILQWINCAKKEEEK